MKLFKVSLFVALLVSVCLPTVVQAQMRVNIPFGFSAAGKSLPAGHYKVSQAFGLSNAAWCISDDHHAATMLTNSASSSQKVHRPSLVFLHTGGEYSLVQVWTSESAGRELVMKPKVNTTVLAEGAKYVQIGAE